MGRTLLIALGAAGLLFAACERKSELYCFYNPLDHDNCPAEGGDNIGNCDPDNCPSHVCLPEDGGTCADSSIVLYAAPDGIGDACTELEPCLLDAALAKANETQAVIKLRDGNYKAGYTIPVTTFRLRMLGPAVIEAPMQMGTVNVLEVPPGANLELFDLGIAKSRGMASRGIGCTNATLSGHNLQIAENENGLVSDSCTLEITRSKFFKNKKSAAVVGGGTVTFESNFVYANEGATIVSIAGPGQVRFNTIAFNFTVGLPLSCSGGGTGVDAQGNIVTSNGKKPGMRDDFVALPVQTMGCEMLGDSFVLGEIVATGWKAFDPDPNLFSTNDYHLTDASQFLDVISGCDTAPMDYDGEPRPMPANASCDLGADELAQ